MPTTFEFAHHPKKVTKKQNCQVHDTVDDSVMNVVIPSKDPDMSQESGISPISKWWFQLFFMFIPIWGRFPF